MGPGIVIFFWLIIAALFGGVWLSSLVLFIISRKKDWRIAKWLSGASLTVTSLLGLLCVCLMVYGFIRATIPRFVFEEALGKRPPPQVAEIESKVWWFADEGSTWLTFKTDHNTFKELLPEHLARISLSEYRKSAASYSGDLPKWWRPLDDPDSEIYFSHPAHGQGQRFASEDTLMVYSPRTKRVYYQFIGID